MSFTNNSANMLLPIPAVGLEPGPDYATDVNNCLTLIDSHDHSFGYGVQVKPDGMNINADLPFNDHNLTESRSIRFENQSATLSTPYDIGCIYEAADDLYFNDGVGNIVRITQNGSVTGAAGTITGLPSGTASASYNAISSKFIFQSATNTAASIDVGNVIMRNLTANSFALTLSPPAAMGSNIAITLPTLPAVQSFMTLDNSGQMSAPWTVDGTTVIISSNQLVAPSGINYSREHNWELNGPYGNLTYPQTDIDAIFFAPYNLTIQSVWIYNGTAGASGTTEFDLKVASPGGSFTSILTTTGKITSAAAANIWTDSGAVVAAQTGVTKPLMNVSTMTAGQALRFDLIQAMASPVRDARIRIYWKQT